MTAEERELRKERRKSMPLQSSSTANAIAQPTIPQSVSKAVEETIKIEPNGSSLRFLFHHLKLLELLYKIIHTTF
jgi:hypothetical protein